jgi:hypothetical protein
MPGRIAGRGGSPTGYWGWMYQRFQELWQRLVRFNVWDRFGKAHPARYYKMGALAGNFHLVRFRLHVKALYDRKTPICLDRDIRHILDNVRPCEELFDHFLFGRIFPGSEAFNN